MEIKLSLKEKKEILDIIKEFGYESEKKFIEDALKSRILELKRIDFLTEVREIRKKMKERKLKEKDILRDFTRFYHKK